MPGTGRAPGPICTGSGPFPLWDVRAAATRAVWRPAAPCYYNNNKEPDTPAHVLLRCPALMRLRHATLGHIHPRLEEVRETSVVAALAAAARRFQSRLAMLP